MFYAKRLPLATTNDKLYGSYENNRSEITSKKRHTFSQFTKEAIVVYFFPPNLKADSSKLMTEV